MKILSLVCIITNKKNSNADGSYLISSKDYPLEKKKNPHFACVVLGIFDTQSVVKWLVLSELSSNFKEMFVLLSSRLWDLGSFFFCCSCSLLLTKLPLFWSCVSSFSSVLQTNSSWPIFVCHQSFEQPVYVDLIWSQKSTGAKIVLEITMKRCWKSFFGTIVYL